MMVQETRDRNHLLETKLAAVLEQARRQNEMRVNRNRSEIERLISQRMTGFFMRGSFGKSIGNALLSFLILLALASTVFVLGTFSERQRGLIQTAYEHPLFLRDINDIAVDVAQNEQDVKNWATILETSRGHTQDMMRECRETTQETKRRCHMHRAFYAHTTKSVLIRPICLCHDLRTQSLNPRGSPSLVDKLVPCVTADINDIVICFEDSV